MSRLEKLENSNNIDQNLEHLEDLWRLTDFVDTYVNTDKSRIEDLKYILDSNT